MGTETKLERALNVAMAVIRADGRLEPEEVELFEHMLESLGIDPDTEASYRQQLSHATPDELHALLTDTAEALVENELPELVRQAYLVAEADGPINESERAVLTTLLRTCQIPASQHAAIHAWARLGVDHARLGAALLQPSQASA